MSRDEARALLVSHLAGYRTYSHARLVELVGSIETAEVRGADGTMYQLEVEFFWDDKKEGDVRVLAAIDGGPISSFRPMTDDFTRLPTGLTWVSSINGSAAACGPTTSICTPPVK